MKLIILKTTDESLINYTEACKEMKVNCQIIDFLNPNWLEEIKKISPDGILHRPFDGPQYLKDMCDEKLYFIEKHLKIPIYPSFDETFIYENKNNMSYWLDIYNIPHASTKVFYRKRDALKYLEKAQYPLVFKTKIGSAGSGEIGRASCRERV